MSYVVHNFEQGDILYANQLNEMDAQIALNEQNIEGSVSSDMLAETYSANKTYSVGDYVVYNNDLYVCISEILAPEGWNPAHWQVSNLGDGISNVKNAISQLAENGYYTIDDEDIFLTLSSGAINNTGGISVSAARGYIWLTSEQELLSLKINTTIYAYNVCYKNGDTITKYTPWLSTSPIQFDSTAHTQIGITVKRLDDGYINTVLDQILYYSTGGTIGNLATKDYAIANQQSETDAGKYLGIDDSGQVIPMNPPTAESVKGLRQIYPDGFTSRIKPDIYYNGRFTADIDIDSYKIQGSGEAWVALDGDDTSGDGTESNPFATITKAVSSGATTIKIKSGTYQQGTHYGTYAGYSGINIIGIGNVVLQNDASGHYVTITGNAYIENITFMHGNADVNSAVLATCNNAGQTVCFVDCKFCNSGANGLAVTGVDAICANCSAYGNKLDGFNYHDKTLNETVYIPNVIEMDCTAYNNGSSDSGSDSCNGSTVHDGVKIIRLNGEYYNCYGGVIAEIARANGEPTFSVNYGVLAYDSTGTGSYNAAFWASINTNVYLYDCKSYGVDYDISAIADAKVVAWRLTTGRDEPSVNVASTATVIRH